MANTQAKMVRLQALLAAYGADPARWPESDRELAPLLAAAHPELDDARSLDSVLGHASIPVAPAAAAERLVASVSESPNNVVGFNLHATTRVPDRRAPLSGRLVIATSLAASLVFGIYLGARGQGGWLTPPLLAEESPEYMSAQLDVLDGTLQLFEDHTNP